MFPSLSTRSDNIMADLFDCFGSEDNDDNDNQNQPSASASSQNDQNKIILPQLRDPDCGVCSQLNAEKSLLMHIKNELSTMKCFADDDNDKEGEVGGDDILARCKQVQSIIDEFCEKRAWMMHIGDVKGMIIKNALKKKLDEFVHQSYSSTNKEVGCNMLNTQRAKFTCVELGTYCGYGSICLAEILYEFSKRYVDIDFHLFTIEINPSHIQIAKEIIQLSKLNNYITILENEFMIDGTVGDVGSILKTGIVNRSSECIDENIRIDFLMIDHDKDSYLHDLQRFEKNGMIQKGTVVIADNVLFAKIDNYISYVKDLQENGIVSTSTIETLVEYSMPDILNNVGSEDVFRDGIGMFSIIFHSGI